MCSFLHFLNTRTFKTIFLNIWMYHIHGTQIWRRIVRIVNSMHLTQSPCHFIIARNSIYIYLRKLYQIALVLALVSRKAMYRRICCDYSVGFQDKNDIGVSRL